MQDNEELAPDSWLRHLVPGDEVFWCDPDRHISSGIYKIDSIVGGWVENLDTIVVLKNSAGSTAEVFASELAAHKPDNLLQVVFRGMIFGYADSADLAIDKAADAFNVVFEQVHAAIEENAEVNGEVLGKAWVVRDPPAYAPCRLRLTLDVTYDLAGESADEMRDRLCRMVEMAIDNGLLTGHTEATVEEHSVKVREIPEPLTEKELADFMLRRIENQQIEPEDIPQRLARYGLMDPIEFVIEMRERLENEAEEA
ncbi:MAG: hypothetical protein BroJett012_08830 [Betaproteobacteria bacterium]|nr:MAG: hypothetical protein BroJett012_08830 [Betaproteobacteria bacterium]